MKIRIQDSSVRFRVTVKEVETLQRDGRLEAAAEIRDPDTGAVEGRFAYAVERAPRLAESRCAVGPAGITLRLTDRDVALLADSRREGVYLRREALLPDGTAHRFLAFIEKDRPTVRCAKPEKWIYEFVAGEPRGTRAADVDAAAAAASAL